MTSTRNELADQKMSAGRKAVNASKKDGHPNTKSDQFRVSTALTSLPLAALIALGFGATANAAVYTWTGAGSRNWNSVSNWAPGGIPMVADSVGIDAGSSPNQPLINSGDVDGKTYVNNLSVIGGSLTVGDGYILDIAGNFGLSGTAVLNGPGFLDAHGLVTLSGGTISDGTGIQAPLIIFDNVGVVEVRGWLSSEIEMSGTGLVGVYGENRLTDLVVSPTEIYRTSLKVTDGIIDIFDAQDFSGGTTIEGGTVIIYDAAALGTGDINLNSGGLYVGSDVTITNKVSTGNSVATRTIREDDDDEYSLTLNGILDGAGALTKTGTSILVIGSGANTDGFTGGVALQQGTLSLQKNIAASFGTITTTGSVIDYGNGVNSAAAININSDTTQLQVLTGAATQSGVISETSGPRRFEKIGSGRLILTAANSFTGNTWIRGGVLNVRNGAALGGIAATLVRDGAALELEGGIDIGNEEITLIGTGVANGGALRNVSGNNKSSGHIQMEFTTRINSDSGTLTIDGALRGAGGNDGLFIGGPGTVTFSGDGPTKGAVIAGHLIHDGGTLNIEDGVSFTAKTVSNSPNATINNSGTLSGSLVGPGNEFSNLGTLNNLATGILNGDLSNLGTANLRGIVNGNVLNGVDGSYSGILSLQDGAINNLTINGNLTSENANIIKFDTKLDRPAGQADLITVNGDFTGSYTANFSNIGSGTLDTPGTTTFITVTGANDATLAGTTGLLQTSVMENQVLKSGQNWVIQTAIKLNPINKLVGSIVTAQDLVPTSIPDLPFQNSNLKEGCVVTGTGSPFAGRATGSSTTSGGTSPNASSSVDVSYGGLQFNIDYGCFDVDGKGSSIRVGALGGFSFGNTGQNDITQNVMTNSDFETRFGGVYTKFDTANGFFASLSGIHSETNFDIASTISGIDFVHDRNFKTRRNAINGEVGMAFKPTADVSITPVLGINYSVSELSDMTITGPGGGTLVFDDIVGIVGYTGVTLSRVFALDDGKSAWSPFLGIKIYNDFGESVVATYVSPSGNKTPTYTQKAGTYGELTAGLNYSSFNPGWSGVSQLDASIRADLSFGQQFNSGRVTANLQFRF